jgi:hypothetical protein
MRFWTLSACLARFLVLLPVLAFGQTPTPTCGVANFVDTFPSASSLSNFDYWGDHWAPETAASLFYDVTGGELVVGGSSQTYSFALLQPSLVPHTTANVVLEADFMQENGPGVFGLVFRADAAAKQAYIFQWNGMNGRWEIEKKFFTGLGSSFDYVASGGPIPFYAYGTWVHLKVVVGPGNSFTCYVDLNDGSGERLAFSGVADTVPSPPSPPPYTKGAVGLRIYEASSSKLIHVDGFQVNVCSFAPSLPQAGARVYPSPARRGFVMLAFHMEEAGRMECRIWNSNGELTSKLVSQAGGGDGTAALDLSKYVPGVYFYSVLFTYDSGKVGRSPAKTFVVVP